MTLREAVANAAADLATHGVPSPRVDAELLVAHALGLTRTQLYAASQRELVDGEVEAMRSLVARRARREPLAYILGEWGFRRLTLNVDPRALIPRPETEIVVERCLELLRPIPHPRVLDVGVGSGAIALSLVDEHPGAAVLAIDAADDALDLARENAARTGLGGRVELRRHDFHEGLPAGRYDLVVSNPPYVREEELPSLQPEVRDWEPRGALVGPGAHAVIAAAARSSLASGGHIVFEVAEDEAPDVADELRRLGYAGVTIGRDLAGAERVVWGSFGS